MLEFPYIPDGDPLTFRGQIKGFKADLVKGVIRLSIDVSVSPETLAHRSKVALLVEMERAVYVEVQPFRLPADVEAAQRAAAEAALKLHQLPLTVERTSPAEIDEQDGADDEAAP